MNTAEKRIAFIQSQTACALADIEGMKAENAQFPENQQYGKDDFFAIPDRYGISHNAVIEYLRDI